MSWDSSCPISSGRGSREELPEDGFLQLGEGAIPRNISLPVCCSGGQALPCENASGWWQHPCRTPRSSLRVGYLLTLLTARPGRDTKEEGGHQSPAPYPTKHQPHTLPLLDGSHPQNPPLNTSCPKADKKHHLVPIKLIKSITWCPLSCWCRAFHQWGRHPACPVQLLKQDSHPLRRELLGLVSPREALREISSLW